VDELDVRLIDLFGAEPRIGVLEASRRLGVARGTVQARLDKLVASGVVTGWGPDLSPEALGFPVTAFLTLEIRQGTDRDAGGAPAGGHADDSGHDAVGRHLAGIAEVLEAHTITGAGDLWVRVVARSNADLQRVIDRVLETPAIVRSATVIALATQVPYRVLPLARSAAGPEPAGTRTRPR
jgi:DNA-binding Lrp family transcriptional regulator